jgi:hypothetical protein
VVTQRDKAQERINILADELITAISQHKTPRFEQGVIEILKAIKTTNTLTRKLQHMEFEYSISKNTSSICL